ncbi:SDR family NAD(P)-dependent oxidoreductase [Neobacillus terrae]|uniref:SDR family NAD(P)-dependent oxidoreductase n=1 Tax=Neobacillus terrae TaxID=3034837 RepID=UPI00140D4F3A|nr:polysaccharide biosynthesis protein [Neobacillus terrae]
MTYKSRLAILVVLDSILVVSSLYISYGPLHQMIRLTHGLFLSALILLISHHVFASVYRLYNKAWEYASIGELLAIVKAVTLSVAITAIFQFVFYEKVYFRALVSTWMLYMLLVGGSRFIWRMFRDTYFEPKLTKKRALIIGAGSAGTMVVRQLQKSVDAELQPVAFIDDDPKKYKLQYLNIPVYGNKNAIQDAVTKLKIDNIIIAIPSLNKEELNQIFEECAKTKVKTQIIPKLEDLMTGKISVNQFRKVQVEDLLGREPVELDITSISEYVTGKTVLVTGAGGSIGSEICRQICKFNPSKIVLVGHGENSIYQIDMELRKKYQQDIEIVPVIGDIQDRDRMFEVMEQHFPFVVYHAAAHKHVPLMEYNPREAVKNNIFGTKNVADAADTFGVNTFVLISSDKAVNPPNVMGATKRFAEMIIQHLAEHSRTKFVAVRFGNVLGSRGSVIPLFKRQIQAGGPVTVTHPDMTRYFMTIPEASRLVIQAGSLARGGEIFVLDMGEPVKIVELARNLIKLSGYSIEEVGIKYSGIRPGEKMYEELLNENEIHHDQIFPKIHIGKATLINQKYLLSFMQEFESFDEAEIKNRLLDMANNRIKVTTAV